MIIVMIIVTIIVMITIIVRVIILVRFFLCYCDTQCLKFAFSSVKIP